MMKGTDTHTPQSLLVLGGCRSGKSGYAEQWLADRFPRKLYIATLEVSDDTEMVARAVQHRERRDDTWTTAEAPLLLVETLLAHQNQTDAVLVDCVTMWITNRILAGHDDTLIDEGVEELAATVTELACPVVLVANEVGLGLVPESPLGRRFRDLAGKANQRLAAACDQVVLVVAGLPLFLKS